MQTELAGEDSRTQYHAWADDKGFEMSEVWSSIGEPFESEDTQLAWEIWQASRAVMSKPQRITEQDAQKFALSTLKYWTQVPNGSVEGWFDWHGRTLLAKLNEHRELDYKAQEWQSIETAPKDGTKILLVELVNIWLDGEMQEETHPYVYSGFYNGDRQCWECLEYEAFPHEPTHWMLLPNTEAIVKASASTEVNNANAN